MEWALEYSRYKLCSIQSLATLGKFNLSLLQYKIEILGKLMTVMEGWGLDPQDALDPEICNCRSCLSTRSAQAGESPELDRFHCF